MIVLIGEKLEEIKAKPEFHKLDHNDKNRVLEPILKEKERAKNERYIGNLRNQRSEFGDLLTAQLNLMVELATPNEDDDKPKRQFIKQSNIHTSYNKKNWKPKKMWMNI